MRDIEWLFLILTLFNTNLGMNNSSKNSEQYKNLQEIHDSLDAVNEKLDSIMEAIKNE